MPDPASGPASTDPVQVCPAVYAQPASLLPPKLPWAQPRALSDQAMAQTLSPSLFSRTLPPRPPLHLLAFFHRASWSQLVGKYGSER